MSAYPIYFKEPVRVSIHWLRYQAHNKPHLFFSGFIAFLGPVFLFAGTPLRRTFLYADATPLPLDGYPVPNRARSSPAGYED
ncbi:hypothetical protein C6P40_000970 [Pichia californica]|uniref:NADH-ubiquinone oxidoreductase 9.5 kDa subunit n=1 Tax=Pichia californica TaxID=460514 RepID=A0A9P6WK61_9ASCO|nr:hypothetical protein C6P40_000970 [[Candida] californica]